MNVFWLFSFFVSESYVLLRSMYFSGVDFEIVVDEYMRCGYY